MRSFRQGVLKIVGAVALAAVVVLGGGGAVSASPVGTLVSGQVVCDENANQSVVWTFENYSSGTLTIAKATVDHSGLTSGSIGDANVNMGPSFIVPSGGTATGITYTSNNPFVTLGPLSITVSFDGGSVSTSVQLVGCVAGATTTTGGAATTTTVAPTTVAPTTGAPTTVAATDQSVADTFAPPTGSSLPATGDDHTGLVTLAMLMLLGGFALLVVRRPVR